MGMPSRWKASELLPGDLRDAGPGRLQLCPTKRADRGPPPWATSAIRVMSALARKASIVGNECPQRRPRDPRLRSVCGVLESRSSHQPIPQSRGATANLQHGLQADREALSPALFSSNHWSEESRQVRRHQTSRPRTSRFTITALEFTTQRRILRSGPRRLHLEAGRHSSSNFGHQVKATARRTVRGKALGIH